MESQILIEAAKYQRPLVQIENLAETNDLYFKLSQCNQLSKTFVEKKKKRNKESKKERKKEG